MKIDVIVKTADEDIFIGGEFIKGLIHNREKSICEVEYTSNAPCYDTKFSRVIKIIYLQ